MAVLSFRVDDDLKKSLEWEAKKENISLSEYIKKNLKSGLLEEKLSNTKDNLSNSKDQVKKFSEISNEAISEVERKIIKIGGDAEKYNYIKTIKKTYWILMSASFLFFAVSIVISIPTLLFSLDYLAQR